MKIKNFIKKKTDFPYFLSRLIKGGCLPEKKNRKPMLVEENYIFFSPIVSGKVLKCAFNISEINYFISFNLPFILIRCPEYVAYINANRKRI